MMAELQCKPAPWLQQAARCSGLVLLMFSVLGGQPAGAQPEPAVGKAFQDAAGAFVDGYFERAERELAQFVAVHPQSPLVAEALLLQARAAMKLGKLPAAVSLLNSNLAHAGPLADQYHYRIGEAHMLGSNFLAAAAALAALARDFTNSTLLLEASHHEGLARFRLRDFARVVALLQNSEGAFQRASRARPTDELTARGRLLLADALLELGRFADAERAVAAIADRDLTPDLKWDRQYAVCRILLADRRLPEALTEATNLVSLALGTAKRTLQADAFAFVASILRQLERPNEAIQVLTNNLAGAAPADRRRFALLHIIEIEIARTNLAAAAQELGNFLSKHPEDAASDVALQTLGELQLRLYLSGSGTDGTNATLIPLPTVLATATNRLQQAQVYFDRVISGFTNSPVRGMAFLNKGWCLWLDKKPADAAVAFRAALELLPPSEEAVVARFKLADAQFEQRELTNALASYRGVASAAATRPRTRENLLPQALYQITRVSIELGDQRTADDAMRLLLSARAESPLAEPGLLLLGQMLNDARNPAGARALYADFARRFPTSPLLPEVRFAQARTHVDADEWPAAMGAYERWIEAFPTNDARPRAEFDLAWSNWRAGQETNALSIFTNFLVRFSTNELARLAQFWVGDYYMRHENYVSAQSEYQRIVESPWWPVTNITYRARLAAGQAAFKRQGWGAAMGHFTNLVNDVVNCPADVAAEAMYALGDTMINNTDTGRTTDRFAEAKKLFEKIPQLFETNELARHLVPAAWGRIGDCALQLAVQDTSQYAAATNAYWRVVTNDAAGGTQRSMAAYGVGRAFEAQAAGSAPDIATNLITAAFDQYYSVVTGSGPLTLVKPEPAWVRDAGFAAIRIAEERRQWQLAARLYERITAALPALKARLQDRIDKARDKARLEGG